LDRFGDIGGVELELPPRATPDSSGWPFCVIIVDADADAVSELMWLVSSLAVAMWVRSHGATELYTTSITLADILYGIERLRHGRRKDLLRTAANDVFSAFPEHVLAFDMPAAAECAGIVTHREHEGLPLDGFDAQIAAVCRMPCTRSGPGDAQRQGLSRHRDPRGGPEARRLMDAANISPGSKPQQPARESTHN
jgi:predicted nucleic acid-binding protein